MALCHMEYILTHHGTFTKETYPFYCRSGFSQGTIPTKTDKHNHFKQTEAEIPETLIEPCHEIMVLFDLSKLILQTD